MRLVPMARESISRLNQSARRLETDGATMTDAVSKVIEAVGLVHIEGEVYRSNNGSRRYWRAVRVIREGHDAGFYSVSAVRKEQMETEVSQFIAVAQELQRENVDLNDFYDIEGE